MHIPYIPRDTPYLGKTDRPFYRLFNVIFNIHPLSREIFPILTPYLGNIMVTHFPFLLFSLLSSGSRNMCTYFTTTLVKYYPRGFLPQKCNEILKRTLSSFLGRLLKAQKTCTYKSCSLFLHFSRSFWKTPHISGNWFKNTPFFRFSRGKSSDKRAKIPFSPRKLECACGPLVHVQCTCTFEWGPGGNRVSNALIFPCGRVFMKCVYRLLRARRVLMIFNEVQFRTRRVLLPYIYTLYSHKALLVLNRHF